MMKRDHKSMNLWSRIALTCCLALVGACSDGGSVDTKVEPILTPPAVESFAASSVLVNKGDSITLSWRVSLAEKVELSSKNATIPTTEVKNSDSTSVVVTKSETFILTATNDGIQIRRNVNVTVKDAAPKATIVSFAPKKPTIALGDSTQLCFEVQPADADVVVKNASDAEVALEGVEADTPMPDSTGVDVGNPGDTGAVNAMTKLSLAATLEGGKPVTGDAPTVVGDDDKKDDDKDDKKDEEKKPDDKTDMSSKKGCTVLLETLNAGDNVFTLTVTGKDGSIATQKTTVTVTAEVTINTFTVNGETSVTVAVGTPLTLAWNVTPANAILSIEPGVGAVPSDETGAGQKTTKATTSVTYVLTAEHPTTGAKVSQPVTVLIEATPVISTLTLQASNNSVFAGESVTFTVKESVSDLALRLPDGSTQPMNGGSVTIDVTQSGGYQAVAGTASSVTGMSHPVSVEVRTWGTAKGGGKTWVSLNADAAAGRIMTGTNDAATGGSTTSNDWSVSDIDVVKVFAKKSPALKKVGSKKPDRLDAIMAQYGPYSVNAFAMDANKDEGQRVYAGMTGGLAVSQNGGKSWTAIDHMLIWDVNGSYRSTAHTYTSCHGAVQTGITSAETDWINVHSVCDLEVDANGRLYAATDAGVIYLEDPDAAMQDLNAANGWKGYSTSGTIASGSLYGTLTHDIALGSNSETVYAATELGIYMNSQGGADGSWTAYGNEKATYAIAVDANNSTIYAGTADGEILVRSTTGDSGSWTSKKSVGEAVYSLSVDNGTVLAGTGAGVFLSRDSGATWANITASMEGTTVYGVSVISKGNQQLFAAATDAGVYVSRGKKAVVVKVDDAPVEPETPMVSDTVEATLTVDSNGSLTPDAIDATTGNTVKITFDNTDGDQFYTIGISDPEGTVIETLQAKRGESVSVTITANVAGEYQLVGADASGQQVPGMAASITVQDAGSAAAANATML